MAGINDLPPEIALKRVLTTKESAQFCGYSEPGWRRLHGLREVPTPVKLSGHKIGWQVGDLVEWLESKKQPQAA